MPNPLGTPIAIDRAAAAAIAVGFVGAAVAAVCGVVLADVYRPEAPWGDLPDAPAADPGSSAAWSRVHLWASVASLVASLAASVCAVLSLARRSGPGRSRRRLLVALGVAVGTALATLWTRPLVRWDQLALRSISTGAGVDGYWPAAFSDEVLFILVGGVEVTQGSYAPVLIAHLAAPVIVAIALVIAIGASGDRR